MFYNLAILKDRNDACNKWLAIVHAIRDDLTKQEVKLD